MFKLVIQDDEGKTTIVPLIRDEITIGRKEGNTIRLTERNVSRRHARILRNNGEVQIEDLGSYNGIRVNNARIAERVSLRVSDQVQIGDYKLYLKAEGVEQVDEARTMPIERLDAVAPTDQIAAVAAPATAPMAVVATPQIVGSPNRTLVAIADTDPQGRPVATAAAVAALTAPVGYGKLVVLSSNFAGKEFELSRPQMIIGRTDENDIVINHRSISRNHAKLVREPESGRYTISDLQSSNGVRVNGQDYGKVELRRGDVVDLGHVRLRFIEPGEDFVFSRDAVITDVPDAGGKRGLLVAVVLAILVLGAVGVFFLIKNNDSKTTGTGNDVVQPGSNEPQGSNVVDAATQVATNPPPVTPDAAGSDHPVATNPSSDDIEAECSLYKADKKWTELHNCGERLQAVNAARGKELIETANSETQASIAVEDLRRAIDDGNLREAKKQLDKIKIASAYHQVAADRYNAAESKAQDEEVSRVNRLVAKNDCKGAQAAAKQAASRSEQIGQAAVAVANRCVPASTVQQPPPLPPNGDEQIRKDVEQATAQANKLLNKSPPDCQGLKTLLQSATKDQVADAIRPIANRCKAPVATECDAEDFKNKGTNSFSMGQFAASLGFFEQALACKPSVDLVKLAYTAACNARNATKAKLYFQRLSSQVQKDVQVICIRNMIQVP